MESLESKSNSPPIPPISSFPFISPLFLLLELENVLRGIGKPYVKSLDSRVIFTPRPSLMGQTGVIK